MNSLPVRQALPTQYGNTGHRIWTVLEGFRRSRNLPANNSSHQKCRLRVFQPNRSLRIEFRQILITKIDLTFGDPQIVALRMSTVGAIQSRSFAFVEGIGQFFHRAEYLLELLTTFSVHRQILRLFTWQFDYSQMKRLIKFCSIWRS